MTPPSTGQVLTASKDRARLGGCLLLALLLGATSLAATSLAADPPPTTEEEDWEAFEAWADDIERALQVSLGELRFVEPPEHAVHHHENRISLDADSLETGWATMHQCHYNLDQIRRAQVIYREGRIKDIEVTEAVHIDRAWPEAHSVQMEGVRAGAKLCVKARSRVLEPATLSDNGEGYVVRNGPFMRKFLDGYYPMQVTLTIEWPEGLLRFDHSVPAATEGFSVDAGEKTVRIDTWFEGELNTALYFSAD